MAPLGVGIIGCGTISGRYFTNAPLFPGLEIRACADRLDDAARRAAEQYGVRLETVDGLLRADDIELVVNLTIPASHSEISTAALLAGKHVYSEKPLAATAATCRDLVDLAERRGLRLGTAPDTFLGAAGHTARRAVDDGRIGRVVGGTCHMLSRGADAWHPNPDFLYQVGGGPILDFGPYYVTMLVNLLGPVAEVSARAAMPFATRTIGSGPRQGEAIPVETPTTVHCTLGFVSGPLVAFSASWDVWKHGHNTIEIYGEEGSLLVPNPNFFHGDVQLSERDGDFAILPDNGHPFARVNREMRTGAMVADYRIAGLADMAMAMADGRPHRCDGVTGLHVMEVLEGILQSAADGRAVAVSTRCARPATLDANQARTLMGDGAFD